MKANLDASLVKKLRRSLTENENLAKAFAKDAIECPKAPIQIHFNKRKTNWTNDLVLIKSMPIDSVNQRFAVYEKIKNGIPEKITQEESIETLKIINNIFSNNNIIGTTQERDRWQFASIVADSAFDKIFGIINHCLHNMHKESKLSIDEIIKNNDNNFNLLFVLLIFFDLFCWLCWLLFGFARALELPELLLLTLIDEFHYCRFYGCPYCVVGGFIDCTARFQF